MSSLAILIAGVCGFAITAGATALLIPMLKKLKFGQSIREDGPTWHSAKAGTPTMGGISFVIGVVSAVGFGFLTLLAVKCPFDKNRLFMVFAGLLMAVGFGAIGFIDDYIKVVKKRNLGLTAGQKIVLQVLVTSGYLTALYFFGENTSVLNLPFLGSHDWGFISYILLGILIIGVVNSVNLNDGIDGLCSANTFVVGAFFMIAAAVFNLIEINVLATALAASCIGFLVFNAHPAKVFMGDTGSFFLGGCVVALAFAVDMEFLLFFVGFVYCFESLSVILQVISVKTTGKRIFKMSPIHHHFELLGMSENKIVIMFCSVTLIMSVIGFFALKQIF